MKIARTTLLTALIASSLSGAALARPDDHNHGPQRPAWHERQTSDGHHWRKGQRLAPNQRRYVVNDWNRRGLRAPPRGYHWVRENNNSGDYILVAAATGIIASILAQQ
jgi:Ni/Co efflux regulator RcnB